MTKQRTEYCLLLDCSGSMDKIRDKTIIGYNEHIQQIKLDAEDQKDTNEFFVSLFTFNGKVYERFWRLPASELQEITRDSYVPNGDTALYDAQGYAIDKYIEMTDLNDPNAAYLMQVFSDGDNRKIIEYTLEKLVKLCEFVQSKGNFTIAYMGCGDYVRRHAQATKVPLGNCAIWQADQTTADFAFTNSVEKLKKYGENRKSGIRACATYHSDDASMMANYVPPDTDMERLRTKYLDSSRPIVDMPYFGPVGDRGNYWTRAKGDQSIIDPEQVHTYLRNHMSMDVIQAKDYRRQCEEQVICQQAKAAAAKPAMQPRPNVVTFKDGDRWRHVRTTR